MKLMKRFTAVLCSAMLLIGLMPTVAWADGAQTIVVPDGAGVSNPAAEIRIVDPAADSNFYLYSYDGTDGDKLVFPQDYPYYDTTHTVTVELIGENPDQVCDDKIAFFSGNECCVVTASQDTTGGNIRTCTVKRGGYAGPAPYTVVASSGARAAFLVNSAVIPSKVTLNYEKLSIPVGEVRKLTASAAGTWSSSDDSVATVSAAGVVTGVSDGVADITLAYQGFGQTLTGTCKVTVGSGVVIPDPVNSGDKNQNGSTVSPSTDNPVVKDQTAAVAKIVKGGVYTAGSGVSGAQYKVTSISKRTVAYAKCISTKNRATVPSTVKLADGKTYTVVKIASGSFQSAKNVKTVTVQAKKLTKKNVKNCFKGSKVTKVKTVKYNSYKKYFVKSNCGKKVKIAKI